jgi:hypothetical protein
VPRPLSVGNPREIIVCWSLTLPLDAASAFCRLSNRLDELNNLYIQDSKSRFTLLQIYLHKLMKQKGF